jgi:hypothetical protein
MKINPQLVIELRAKFRAGCTPSLLIKHIAALHHHDQNLFSLVQAYFREAFHISLVRISNQFEDLTNDGLRNAHLNSSLLHEMIQRFSEWGAMPESTTSEKKAWFDSLVATDEAKLIIQAQPGTLPEFSNCWQDLDLPTQEYIKRIIGNANSLYEKVRILANFAELLQQQVSELRKRLDGVKSN